MFVRRHRTLAAGVLTAAACLIGGVTPTTAMWLHARAAADLATRQKSDKEFINEFLQSAFLSAAPEASGRELTVRQLLDVAASHIETEAAGDPLILADLHVFVGDAYQALDLNEAARPHFERAVELRGERLGAAHADSLDAQRRAFHALAAGGRQREGADQLRDLLGRCREALGDRHPVTFATLMDWVLAEPAPPRSRNVEQVREHDGQIQEFLRLAQEALHYYEDELGPDHEQTLATKRTIAHLYVLQNDFEAAVKLTSEIIAQLRPIAGDDPRRRAALADALANLTRQLVALRRIDEADLAIREALDIDVELHGENHGRTLLHRGARLEVLRFQEQRDEVESEMRALAAGTRAFYGPHPQSVLAAIRLGQFLLRQGRRDEARAAFTEADELCRVVDGPLAPGRMNVFVASLGPLPPEAFAEAIVADAQRTVREGLASEPKALRFALDYQLDRDMWPTAVELARQILNGSDKFPTLPVEQIAEIMADAIESTLSRPELDDGAAFCATILDQTLDTIAESVPVHDRLRLLRQRCGVALDGGRTP